MTASLNTSLMEMVKFLLYILNIVKCDVLKIKIYNADYKKKMLAALIIIFLAFSWAKNKKSGY